VSANLYYVDLYNGRAANQTGQPAAFPEVVAGGTLSFALRFLEYYGAFTEKDQDIAALRVGLGTVDARPTGGEFSLKIGTGTTVVGGNTTLPLSYIATATQVEAALNALTVGGSYSVIQQAGSYQIARADGAAMVVSVVSNKLEPVSFGRILAAQTAGKWSYELRLTVAPLSFSDSATRVLPDAPSITTLVDGGTDASGTYVWNEIQQLRVPRNWRGTYQIRYGQFAKTELLDPLDGAAQIQRAINAMLTLPDGSVLGDVLVNNPEQDVANIEFRGDLGGANVSQLQVVVFSAPQGDWTFDLPLDRYELFAALREAEVLTLPFEAEADFYLDPANPSAGFVTRKLWQTTLRVRRPQIWPDMAVVPGVDWLRVNPEDYVPFTANQIVTGPQTYSATIGNGSADSFTVTHGLNTQAIANIIVRRNTAAWTALTEGVDFNATITNANEVQLAFGTAPTSNGVLVYVQAAPAVRQWDAHTHTQEQIVGLTALLENILQRLTLFDNLLPKAGAAGQLIGGQAPQEFTLPKVGEILPDLAALSSSSLTLASQIVVGAGSQQAPQGTDAAAAKENQKEESARLDKDNDALPANVLYRALIPGVGKTGLRGKLAVLGPDGEVQVPEEPEVPSDPAVWPARGASMVKAGRWPILLPAIQSSNVLSFGTASVLPEASQSAGTVWLCTNPAGVSLPGDGGRKGQTIKSGERFGSDGRALYRVNSGQGNYYYPAEMDRELWRVFFDDAQLPEGSVLNVAGELRTRMLGDFFDDDARGVGRVDVAAQYVLLCEAVPVLGTAVLGQVAAPVVLGQTRITLSPSLETFRWSLSVRREALTMVSAWTAYRKTMEGGSFSLPAAIRLRLTNFDIDDASPDPRGQVALIMPPTRLDITL
jgi:hypothetical protein